MTIARTEPAPFSARHFPRARALFAAILAVAGLGVFAAACGKGSGLGGCTVDGQTCSLGCVENVGCAQCGADGDCPLTQPRCVAGRCEACAQTSDCGAGMACYPRNHECGPICTSNAQCSPEAPICDTATGACVGCRDLNDCPTNAPVCNAVDQQCAACGANADCGAAAPVCDVRDGVCRQCVVDADCPAGDLCHDNHCEPGCTANSQCGGDRPICNTATGACVGCIGDGDCHAPTATCRADGRCVQCLSDSNCAAPTAFCDSDGLCVQCIDSSTCGVGLKCKDHACVAK
jgi:hypothetical protein